MLYFKKDNSAAMMNKKVVFVSGHFNVLHVGHLRLLRFAKECGNYLIVGVESDKIAGDAAYVNENLRLEGIKSISWIDESFIFNEELIKVIEKIKPDFVVKGKEHEFSNNIEDAILKKIGGKLVFSSGESLFSSIDLIRHEISNAETRSICIPRDFISRNKINISKLNALISQINNLRVCIIGDLIIDEYITCEALGMSQEDPTIVVTPIDFVKFIGGAGIVAAHAKGLGAEVTFISVSGDDELKNYATNKFHSYGINHQLLIDSTRPTTLKQRFRCKGKTLLRVSHLHQNPISQELQTKIFNQLEKNIDKYDLLVFSDFNYGCLPQELVDKIIKLCEFKKIFLAADSQSSSQYGDISRFKNMNLITPTEREARLSIRNQEDGLVVLADKIITDSNAKNIILKLGAEGILIYVGNEKRGEGIFTDRINAMNSSPKDVSGAGDSLLITSAMAMALGGNIWEASFLGSLAAAIQVGRVGNVPLSKDEFLNELNK
jgi:rfaE bifunctional protein kinase chain/domain